MNVNWKKFGRDLKRFRSSANLTLRQAAEQTGMHYATLCRTEQGKYVVTHYYLVLCRWMRADPFDYMEH